MIKRGLQLMVGIAVALVLLTSSAQVNGPGGATEPDFSGPMANLFGRNPAFVAHAEVQARSATRGEDMVMPGRLYYLDGKSRLELELSDLKGTKLTPEAVEQFREIGMDQLATVSDPGKKRVLMIYPGPKAYVETPFHKPDSARSENETSLKLTELGRETVDGHACVKNKAVVIDRQGITNEFIVWNASDMKQFPVKVHISQQNMEICFRDVKFTRPDAALFDPPPGYTKFDSVTAIMQQEALKRMSNRPTGP